MRHIFTLALLGTLTCSATSGAEQLRVSKVEPPNWWAGMHHNRVQLMLYGTGLRDFAVEPEEKRLGDVQIQQVESDHYAFVEIHIPPDLAPGDYTFVLRRGDESTTFQLPILPRRNDPLDHQGFDVDDVVYLITPDRFANGDQSNDRVDGLLDEFDRSNARMRHGGDIQGIIDHLDYLRDLGVTTLWLNPVLENNGVNSYHGYKATDLYRIDPRFGTNEKYRELVREAHQRGLKVIFDHVSNHIGIRHPWVDDLPAPDWLNGSVDNHLRDKHYLLSLSDPHADSRSAQMLKTFWFVDKMPDLNQRNPLLATYLIQNSLWWIESSGLDGIREDTYPYADQEFLSAWAKAIRTEFPQFNIVGEIWSTKPPYIAQFQEKTILPRDFETSLPAVMDFPLMESLRGFVKGETKLRDVHATYAQDFLYTDTENLLVFVDNHDTTRAIFHGDGNTKRVQLALTIMLTARGIPQLLYGTEINMLGGPSHVELRADFPGGFPHDSQNAFTRNGRTAAENEMFDFLQRLLVLRRQHPALRRGKMIHYAPTWNRDVYKFLKITDEERILVIANGDLEERTVDLSELSHHWNAKSWLKDLVSHETMGVEDVVRIPALSAHMYLVSNE